MCLLISTSPIHLNPRLDRARASAPRGRVSQREIGLSVWTLHLPCGRQRRGQDYRSRTGPLQQIGRALRSTRHDRVLAETGSPSSGVRGRVALLRPGSRLSLEVSHEVAVGSACEHEVSMSSVVDLPGVGPLREQSGGPVEAIDSKGFRRPAAALSLPPTIVAQSCWMSRHTQRWPTSSRHRVSNDQNIAAPSRSLATSRS